MMVRVCWECREYVTVREDYVGKQRIIRFENDHQKHPLTTVMFHEVGHLRNVDRKYASDKKPLFLIPR